MDSTSTRDMITEQEPDFLESEVKWALTGLVNYKAPGSDGIPVELLKSLHEDAVKSTTSNLPANMENTRVATGLEVVSLHSNPKIG